jgi:hypothetical protein
MFDALSVAARWFDETADARGWFDPDLIGSATGAYSVTITAGTVPISGGTIAPVFARLDTITAGTVPVTGATVTPVYGQRDSLTAGTVPITGQTVTPVFAITEAITAGTVPITGSNVTVAYGQAVSITAGTVPITGGTLAPVFGHTDAVTAGTVAITGAAVTPVYAQTEAITAGTVPITGASVSLGGPALDIDFTTGTLDSRITFTRASTATYYDSSGLVATAASGVARFDYDPVTLLPRGLLLEEQRTNYILSSVPTTSAWTQDGSTITANAASAPDGTTSASSIVESSANAEHRIYQAVTLTAAGVYSFYAKAGSRQWVGVRNILGHVYANFDLSAGVVGTTNSVATIQSVGGGWYRCTVQLPTSEADYFTINIGDADTGGGTAYSYLGNGTGNIYLWGIQAELGAVATSYIPTTTATVTRAADTASMTGTNFSSWYNSSEGTIVLSHMHKGLGYAATAVFQGATFADQHYFYIDAGQPNSQTNVSSAVVQWTANTLGTFSPLSLIRQAKSFKLNDYGDCVNGGSVAVDSVAAIPPGVATLSLGAEVAGTSPMSGWISRLTFYDTRKTNAELQTLTAVAGATDYSISVTAGTVPITGASLTPVYGQIEAVTAGTVPITGASVTPVYAITEAITPATVAITGASVAPVISRTDAVTAGTVPITGATVAPAFGHAVAVTAGAVAITGATVTPVFGRTDSLTAGTVPISGGNITPIWSSGPTNYSISITAGTVPVTGQTVSPTYARTEAVTAGTVPITGQAISPIRGYAEVITPNVVPITGATVNPIAGIAVNYTITIEIGAVPITGAVVVPFHQTFGWRVQRRGVGVWRPEAAHPIYADTGIPVDETGGGFADDVGEVVVFDEQAADAWANRAHVATSWRPEAGPPSSFTDYVLPLDADGAPLSGAPGEVLIFEEETGTDAWTSRSRTGGTWRRAA